MIPCNSVTIINGDADTSDVRDILLHSMLPARLWTEPKPTPLEA